jgi:hypothetical protein
MKEGTDKRLVCWFSCGAASAVATKLAITENQKLVKPLQLVIARCIVAQVICDGVDANREQVRRGMAWVYDKYATDASLYKVQRSAQTSQIGLWADNNPMPPWQWRNLTKSKP